MYLDSFSDKNYESKINNVVLQKICYAKYGFNANSYILYRTFLKL